MKRTASKQSHKLNIRLIDQFVKFYKRLPASQQLSLGVGALLIAAVPLSVWSMSQQTSTNSKAAQLPNQSPYFQTLELRSGKVGVPYTSAVTMADTDSSVESLSMRFAGLPEGISQMPCTAVSQQPAAMSCSLNGTPKIAGSYTVTVTILDDSQRIQQRQFSLVIAPK